MKVEFNLTFEDYVEWRRPNSPQKLSSAYVISSPGIILALAGFLSLGLGYAILRSSPEKNDFFPGGILLFGGLLATFAAVPVGLLTTRPKPGKTRVDLLREFERFYGDRRSLEADETGWAFIYGAAINKRQWADLTSCSRGAKNAHSDRSVRVVYLAEIRFQQRATARLQEPL